MRREEAREDINRRSLTDFVTLKRSTKAGKGMYNCPVCGSGSGKNGTGAFFIYPDSKRVFCYAGNCFSDKGEDTLGALRIIWQCNETEALERAGYILDGHQEHKEHIKHQEYKKEAADYTSNYKKWHEALKASKEALDYLHKRGISDASIDRFNLGYCENWRHSKAGEKVPPTKRIIIPRSAATFTARRIDKPTKDIELNYIKQVEGRQKDLFNLEAISGETPIICEGELDAISLYQAGADSVIAIGTITNIHKIVEEAVKHPQGVYILALDNDEDKANGTHPGQDAQKKLAAEMKEAGLSVLSFDPKKVYGDAKDANEAFVKDRERLEKMISIMQAKAQEMKQSKDEETEAELRTRTGEGMLEDFLLSVSKKTFEPIPTGITDIDRALEGGFIKGTLVTLGAPPAMGKTALAQWIFENIAQSGQDVLYINLEMSREQLLARSISRLAWKHEKKDISALEVLRGYSWNEDTREAVTKAASIYKRDIAKNFIYNPDGVTNCIDSILKVMEAETARIKAQGRQEPLICIDYLQLIDSGEKDAIEGMKSVIFKLKTFAKEHNTVVMAIVANNRASNSTGTVTMESGRDTSAIEYSADVVLGLAYTVLDDHKKFETGTDKNGGTKYREYDLETLRKLKKDAYEQGKPTPSVCNEISLKVLKSRFTEAERRANLIFDGKHSSFCQIEKNYKPSNDGWNTITDLEEIPFN